jgi:hypothetical protein
VHRIGPDHQPAEPPATPTFLVVYRDAADAVQFLEIGAETARLLEAIEQTPGLSGWQALAAQSTPQDAAAAAARLAITDLLARGVLLCSTTA